MPAPAYSCVVGGHSGVTAGVCMCVMGQGVAGAGLGGTGPMQLQLHGPRGQDMFSYPCCRRAWYIKGPEHVLHKHLVVDLVVGA